jgi:hypothetical protein
MRLADLVRRETGVAFENLMLLRHSTENIDALRACGGTVEEYTYLQPTGSKYDFLADGKPPANVVIVIVDDRVYGVFRVLAVEAEGMTSALATPAYRQFNREGKRSDRDSRRFRLERLTSSADGATVTGWGGKEIATVLRNHTTMFDAIQVDALPIIRLPEEFQTGLTFAEGGAQQVVVNTYERDPKARQACIAIHGLSCAVCGFNFREVYGPEAEGLIHVHHLRMLSTVGEEYQVDPVNDMRPVCPNCHAVIHWGGECRTIEEVKRLLQTAHTR